MKRTTRIQAVKDIYGVAYIYNVSYEQVPYRNYDEVELELDMIVGTDIDINDVDENDKTDYLVWECEEESLVECLQAEGYKVKKF